MIKKIGVLLVTILGGALLVYSATRSLDFIELTLPADRKILAYFGLAALDGGLVAWLLSYLNGSRGAWQRAISILMVIVDTLGAIAMFTFDTLYNTGKNGMTEAMTPEAMTNAVLALSGIIALNIIATIAHHITDPDKLREQAEEEAFAKVEDATLKQISKNADSLAAQLAPVMAADWQTQTQAKYLSYVGTGTRPTIDATARDVTPALPILAQPKPQVQPLDLGGLWAGLFNAKENKARAYESVVNAPAVTPDPKPTEAKAGGLYDAFKQGIAEAQGVTPDKLYSPADGIARVLSQAEPKPKNNLVVRQVPKFGSWDDPKRRSCFEDAPEGETTAQDVINAGLCDCPPEMFDPEITLTGDAREKAMRLAQPFCLEYWVRKSEGGFTQVQRPNARADETCGRCPYFKGEYAKDNKSFTDAPKP